MSAKLSTGRVRQVYRFIEAHGRQYSVEAMCKILEVAQSGYYEWLQKPISKRAQEDARLLRLIRASFVASHGICGAPRVFLADSTACRARIPRDAGPVFHGKPGHRSTVSRAG